MVIPKDGYTKGWLYQEMVIPKDGYIKGQSTPTPLKVLSFIHLLCCVKNLLRYLGAGAGARSGAGEGPGEKAGANRNLQLG